MKEGTLKAGDKVKLHHAMAGTKTAIVRKIDGGYIRVVVSASGSGELFDAEVYANEVKEFLSSDNRIPMTLHRLQMMVEAAAPETVDQYRLRLLAQINLEALEVSGEVILEDGEYVLNPEFKG